MTDDRPPPRLFLGGRLDMHQDNALKLAAVGFMVVLAGTWSQDPSQPYAFFSFLVALPAQARLGRYDPGSVWVRIVACFLAVVQGMAVAVLLAHGSWGETLQWASVAFGLPLTLLGVGTMLRFNLGWYEYTGP